MSESQDRPQPGVNSAPITVHAPDFVPRKDDFVDALGEDRLADRGGRLVGLVLHTRIVRAYARFTEANGRLLSAGISFMALFSLTAAVTLSGMLFSTLLKERKDLTDALGGALNSWLPGLVKTASTPEGLVNLERLSASPGTGAASIIVAVFLIYSASYVVSSMSMAIRAMFGLSTVKEPYLVTIGQRLLGFFILFLALLSTAGFLLLNSLLSAQAAEIAPEAHHGWLNSFSQAITFLVSLLVNGAIMLAFVWWVAGVHPLRRDLLWGSFFTALASSGLRLLGTAVVSKVTGPILTAATGLITLIIWINLQALVVLFVSAWIANPPRLRTRQQVAFRRGMQIPNYPTLSDPNTLNMDLADQVADPYPTPRNPNKPTESDTEQ